MSCNDNWMRSHIYNTTNEEGVDLSTYAPVLTNVMINVQQPIYRPLEQSQVEPSRYGMWHRFFIPGDFKPVRGYGDSFDVTVIVDSSTFGEAQPNPLRCWVVIDSQEVFDVDGTQKGSYVVCYDNNTLPAPQRFHYDV